MNKEELMVGFMFGICFTPIVGWVSIPLACTTALLWALSGMHGQPKFWRRWGVPLTTAFALLFVFKQPVVFLTVLGAFGILSMGYGIPGGGDSGSFLGRFWYDLVGENKKWAEFGTRLTTYLLLVINYLSVLYGFKVL